MVRIRAADSAKMMAYQMPSTPNSKGMSSTATVSQTRVRLTEMTADTTPLFRAVKKAEV